VRELTFAKRLYKHFLLDIDRYLEESSAVALATSTISEFTTKKWVIANHPGGNPGANIKSISHRYYLRDVAFEWELTKQTVYLPLVVWWTATCREAVPWRAALATSTISEFITDYSQVDVPSSRYKSVNVGARKSPRPPKELSRIDRYLEGGGAVARGVGDELHRRGS